MSFLVWRICGIVKFKIVKLEWKDVLEEGGNCFRKDKHCARAEQFANTETKIIMLCLFPNLYNYIFWPLWMFGQAIQTYQLFIFFYNKMHFFINKKKDLLIILKLHVAITRVSIFLSRQIKFLRLYCMCRFILVSYFHGLGFVVHTSVMHERLKFYRRCGKKRGGGVQKTIF